MKPLIWMGTTAEKEGMTEEEFRIKVKIIQKQLYEYKNYGNKTTNTRHI